MSKEQELLKALVLLLDENKVPYKMPIPKLPEYQELTAHMITSYGQYERYEFIVAMLRQLTNEYWKAYPRGGKKENG